MNNKKKAAFGATALAMALLASACGGSKSSEESAATTAAESTTGAGVATTAGAAPSSDLSGSIFVSGSSTVEPITTAVAKLFGTANPKVAIQVEGPGTGDGFAKFCNGETDISNASRPIKAAEAESCAGKGCVEPTAQSIAAGDYPIARNLYIYVSTKKLAESPALGAFVDTYPIPGSVSSERVRARFPTCSSLALTSRQPVGCGRLAGLAPATAASDRQFVNNLLRMGADRAIRTPLRCARNRTVVCGLPPVHLLGTVTSSWGPTVSAIRNPGYSVQNVDGAIVPKNRARWGLVLAIAVVAPACGGESSTSPSTASGAGSSGGSLFVSGSSTVEPITTAVAKLFSAAHPGVAIQVEGPGTGDGFAKFCNGETDISDASRPIKAAEVETCAKNGIEFIELKVAVDGLSVVTSAKNDLIDCLSFADLWVLLGPDAIGRKNWKAANEQAQELRALVGDTFGALHDPYPDASLNVTAPGEESGTFDSFVEIVMAKIGKKLGVEDHLPRPDYTASPNDNVIIDGISANRTSLGWLGYAFVEENLDKIKPLQVDAGKGCVTPTPDAIAQGQYPIARSLYVYVSAKRLATNSTLAGFVDFYLSDEGLGVIGIGKGKVPYVSLTALDIEATRTVWANREVGTRDGGK